MTRRKVFIAFAAAVMILVLTAALFVACDQTKTYTVTFKDGDTVVKTVSVKDGATIADADLPADPAKDGAVFEGWFDGDKAFDKTAAITSDATYLAKWTSLFTVTFKNGDTVIATATVKDGEKIADADIPADPEDEKFAFVGWFVGDAAYDSSAAVTENIVVDAKFSTFFKSYIGTWHGATSDWDPIAYTVVVDANSISVTIGSAEAQVATSIEVDKDGTVMFKLGETDYMLYAYYDGNLHIIDTAEIALSAELAGRVHVSSSDIVGTYTTEGGHTIVINKTFAKVDGILGTSFYYDGRSSYTWANGDKSSSLAYDASANAWIYKEDVSSDADKLIVPELAAIDIPAEFIGNWYGTFESFDSTSYFLVKVTADGVFAYNPGSGFAKVGVATEYKDGKLTVVGLDETITASIADGKLAYKSDAEYGADYQLEKGTVVVFENNYSVFYIAKLGADNKIDQSTFALEDPQMKAGYTFKGWAGDLDGAEFDESATFADSAVFVGSSEKTGYVVTFKKTSSDSDPVIAVVEKTNGKLAADQIPAALTYEDGSVFAGWFTSAGVKATADLAITADTTFIAASVKESDYEGVWVSTESGKELSLVIKNGTISVESLRDCTYTFDTTDGAIKYMVHKSTYVFEYYTVEKTPTGVRYTYKYDDVDSTNKPQVVEYEMTALKAISGVAGSYKSDSASRFVIAENGLVTSAANTDNVFMGYVTGSSKSNFTIVYKTTSSDKVTTVKGARIDAKGNLVLGKSNADAEILIKDLKGFKSYSMADEGTLYVYTNSDDTITYVFKTSSGKYAYVKAEDIKGTIAEGEIFTITYGLYNGTYKKTNTTQTYKIVNGKLTTAGAEKGEYTAEGKGTLTINGFGDATLGEKSYKYSINAKNVVVLTGETTLGVTLDSEAKTYAEVVADGKYAVYVRSDSEKEVITIDGFGGVRYNYNNGYQIIEGTYTFTETALSISGTKYGVNGDYTLEADGKVLVGSKYVYIQKGYTVENHVSEFAGYFVNGTDTIEITVVDGNTVTVILNGSIVKGVTTNWNGTMLTLANTADYDAPKTGWYSDFTIVKDGDNVKLSHACKQSYDSSYESFETIAKSVTFTKSTKPSTGTDAFAGTWKSGSFAFTFDGKGTVTNEDGNSYQYTVVDGKAKFTAGTNDVICTLNGDKLTADYDDGEYQFSKTFTKQAEETLDAFAGTWKNSSLSWTFDGKGNVSDEDGKSYAYTITDGKAVFKTSSYTITCTLSGDNISAYYDDGFGEDCFTKTFTKQA